MTMSPEGYFWFFTIWAIIIAAVTDVTHELAVSSKKH